MSRPGGPQLSPVQIVASLLATLTGAILASYLGVGGTLAGAAVGSIASTTGTEVYRHYLRRSQERLKAAGEVLRHRPGDTGEHARHAATETLAASRAARRPDTSPDATETQVIPLSASAWLVPERGTGPAGRTAGEHATGELTGGAAPDGVSPDGDGSGPWWRGISRRQWLIYGGVAAGLFLVAMVVVTVIELSVGKPLDAAVWGKHSTGTSVSTLVGGGSGQHQQPAVSHSPTPATQSSGSTAPSSSPAATPSGTAPTPTTPASSSAPAATPTPGAGSAQAVTPTP